MTLELADFSIDRELWTEAGRWRCTDVGTRTICAIKLDGDALNWAGQPYGIVEHVFGLVKSTAISVHRTGCQSRAKPTPNPSLNVDVPHAELRARSGPPVSYLR